MHVDDIVCLSAGMVRRVTAPVETDNWAERQLEIAINLEAPVHFMQMLTPHFLKQPEVSTTETYPSYRAQGITLWS